ncbi:adaptor protein MecA [Aerococcus urinae]
MEMEYLNDNTMRVFIAKDDLESRGITLLDLMKDQSQVENFFMSILEEADVSKRFQDSEALTFQVLPKNGGIDLYISKATADGQYMDKDGLENLLENITQNMSSEEENSSTNPSEADTKGGRPELALVFKSWDQVLTFLKSYQVDEASLEVYVYQDLFQVIIRFEKEDLTQARQADLTSYALEFGQLSPFAPALLREHGQLLIHPESINQVAQLFQ